MVTPFSTETEPETAIIVGVILHDQTELQVQEYLDELAFLAETAGIDVKNLFCRNYLKQLRAHLLAQER